MALVWGLRIDFFVCWLLCFPLMGVGLILAAWAIVELAIARSGRAIVQAGVTTAVVACGTLGAHRYSVYACLALHLRQWNEQIAVISAGRTLGSVEPWRVQHTAAGPAVIFLPFGVLNHWDGYVHDPSGEVQVFIADQQSGDRHPAFGSPVSAWFGGTMTHAQHLWGEWYLVRMR